ncbi:NYN domain-containing protein [Aspergillus novofumigatus IBT 16806]|uniref:HTH OST-type domain-containing protein n=1 Tax=Aspergillus novofumigatus (strain IBT 16806) TaxID=1392255 RepID=A0A2I1C7C4_ASPN1|nr:uncharacterized protein P174DRAFT_459712 [Aspergillus novofumigatus IBT 16806]PKX93540.1 hypothetical protein P174DRAFT_459712 [Aspergillus novofumigatus IBT 16806]
MTYYRQLATASVMGRTESELVAGSSAENARSSVVSWKGELLEQLIQPIQQFAYTHGKNATGSAMIIDAMDLLYSSWYDGFCLVSSNNDFTRLAARIRESGLTVYRFREHKTPRPFIAACDEFIYTENLMHIDKLVPHANSTQINSDLASLLWTIVEAASDDDGWARLSKVGPLLTKKYPDFDPRTYRYHKLSDLTTALSFLETARCYLGKGLSTEIFPKNPAK